MFSLFSPVYLSHLLFATCTSCLVELPAFLIPYSLFNYGILYLKFLSLKYRYFSCYVLVSVIIVDMTVWLLHEVSAMRLLLL